MFVKHGENMEFVKYIENRTKRYLEIMPKSERKKFGQFFTPVQIAQYMGSLTINDKETLSILDAGAGSGILSAALVDKIKVQKNLKVINLDLYENKKEIIELLTANMIFIKKELEQYGKVLKFNIINKNFIEENQVLWKQAESLEAKYDIVISNPPYKKIGKKDVESKIMIDIVHGQPNIYFLFMAMAAKLLKEKGEFIFIVPRSFSSGLYFTKFRKWFFDKMKITNMHLFISRGTIFQTDNVLQETIIIKAEKLDYIPQEIVITESENAADFKEITSFTVPYDTCIKNDNNSFLFFPTKKEDIKILDFVNQWQYTLLDIGFRMRTGIVVDFREKEWLRIQEDNDTVPLLWAYNFTGNEVKFPKYNEEKPQYLLATTDTERLQMKVENYLLVKRFTSKEERKRLQCALLFKNDFINYKSISTENHLNYITKMTGEMLEQELYGLFVIFNSNYIDKYFRILNGSTQVNANEINSIPLPSLIDIINLGKQAMHYQFLDDKICDKILEQKYSNALSQNIV